ncbi:hypothetical protein TorRG33x02_089690 [Trema orientale]|uniref:Uncharacterized protein n=1 Tax=Trema orientale TaxID=63057 RepID=A0A2P5FCB2_TREOI|nr:hypothetical protein TorRG33x02_089690 [Trema orientale]
MMLTLSAHLESVFENKPVHNPEATTALQKANIAYLDQLVTTNSLSKELESIKNQLEEKSPDARNEEIQAKDEELLKGIRSFPLSGLIASSRDRLVILGAGL